MARDLMMSNQMPPIRDSLVMYLDGRDMKQGDTNLSDKMNNFTFIKGSGVSFDGAYIKCIDTNCFTKFENTRSFTHITVEFFGKTSSTDRYKTLLTENLDVTTTGNLSFDLVKFDSNQTGFTTSGRTDYTYTLLNIDNTSLYYQAWTFNTITNAAFIIKGNNLENAQTINSININNANVPFTPKMLFSKKVGSDTCIGYQICSIRLHDRILTLEEIKENFKYELSITR